MAAVSAINSTTATLTADAVDTITLGRQSTVEVVHHGNTTEPIYFRTDGTDPVGEADECEVILSTERLTIKQGNSPIKLISAGAVTYTIANVG